MFKKGSKLYSILTGTCPKCQSESMYKQRNAFIIGKTMVMHECCSHCGLKYKIEPNFFFGAMYVSYALAVATGILVFIVAFFILKATMIHSFISIFFVLLCLMPLIARWARNIYINMFIDFDALSCKDDQNGAHE